MTAPSSNKPLLFACSGCSQHGQLAHDLAVVLDKQQLVQMACSLGLATKLPAVLKQVNQASAIMALDGCADACVKKLLYANHIYHCHVQQLSKQHLGHDMTPASLPEARDLLQKIQLEILPALTQTRRH